MKKKILAALTAMIMTFGAAAMPGEVAADLLNAAGIAQTAEALESWDYGYENLDDGTVAITGYTGSATELVIPSEIGGKKVTHIGYSAFYDCYSLTSITIPDSVTHIGYSAFAGCTSLTSITIPDSVTHIGDRAFYDCDSLTSITIPDSVTDIGYSAFAGCTSLTSITIPDSVTDIGHSAFNDCTSLTSITIPDSVTHIGDWAFSWCDSLKSISVSENNKYYSSVDGVLFNKDKSTLKKYPEGKSGTSYVIPDSVTDIGDSAFEDCTSLTSITIPDSVTHIGDSAFSNCDSLTSITIPNSVTDIGDWAFAGCTSLTSITIPDSVTDIGYSAFNDCTSLTSITIPDSVTDIGYWAFKGCSSLKSISVSENNKYYSSVDGVLFNKEIDMIVTYPAGKDTSSYTIPDSVTHIGDKAFGYCYFAFSYEQLYGFKIYCYAGTAGEQYAKDNGFDYELLTAEKPGDITGDNEINMKDLTRLMQYICEWNVEVSGSCDFNGDGKTDIKDLTRLKQYICGWDVELY